MFGLLNTTSMQKKNGFSFLAPDRSYPTATKEITSPSAGDESALSDMTGFNASANGMAVTMRFFNDNWDVYADELMITIGNSSDYIYFQKRKSQLQFRWGIVSGGVVQFIDNFTINHLYDGNHTIGISVASNRLSVCVNGCEVAYQTTGITLPSISASDSVYVGKFYNNAFPVNANMTFDHVRVWDSALSRTELENATFEAEPLVGVTRDISTWTVVKAGQSNSLSDDDSGMPSGLSYTNTSRIKMINKDFGVRDYSDPYATTSYGDWFGEFIENGGFSGVGVTLDNLASAYGGKDFASLACNRGDTGLLHSGGAGSWADGSAVAATSGDGKRISGYTFAAYQSMLIAAQKTNLLALEWYQGETDGADGSTVTGTQYKDALTALFDRWRVVLPPIRIIVGLCGAPVSGFSNWGVIQTAQSEFSYSNTHFVNADGLSVLGAEPYHLDGAGQRDLGILVADKIIKVNQ